MAATLPLKKQLRMKIGDIVDKVSMHNLFINKGFRVLLYHSVTEELVENEWPENTIPKELFEAHIKYLRNEKYNIISCREAVTYLINRMKIPAKTVAIAFDDGYKDNYINALPVIKKYNIHATIFLAVNFSCRKPENAGYLNEADISDLKKTGLIDFGSHGVTHRALSALNDKELDDEIIGAKHKLEDFTNSKIELFAYPFGHSTSYNDKVIEKIKSAGFIGAFTTIFGLNDLRQNIFLLNRNRLSWLDDLRELKKHLNGSYDWCSLFEGFRHKVYVYDAQSRE